MNLLAATGAHGGDYRSAMPAVTETYSLGAPVELKNIGQELKKLWHEGEGAMTRASLMNLVVYSEQPGSLRANTQLVARITENHACRAIVIEADCNAEQDGVGAWISAHCHVSSAGSKQVCSEQISFLLKGGCTRQLPSIVLSIWIQTCRCTFGCRKNFESRLTRSFGPGSTESSTTATVGAIFVRKCACSNMPRRPTSALSLAI